MKSEIAYKVLSLMDLTRLEANDSAESIQMLCQQMVGCHDLAHAVYPAAVCVYPEHIRIVKKALASFSLPSVNIATVVNFPSGNEPVEDTILAVQSAISLGANEIDVVFPWEAYLGKNESAAAYMVKECKHVSKDKVLLKVILETGELKSSDLIYGASRLAIESGADFIKTSTGKVKVNATLQAASSMLKAIKDSGSLTCGFKASGGIRTVEEANRYLMLTDSLMGSQWISAKTFRFGASGLLNDVFAILKGSQRLEQHEY